MNSAASAEKTGVDRHKMNSDGTLDNTSMQNATSMVSDAAVVNEEDSMMYGMPKSPGSFLGTSIRSNQVESFDIESESCSVTGENPGWRLGMPWFSNNHNRHSKKSNYKNQELHRYYGGIMKPSGESSMEPASPMSTTSTSSRHFRPFRKSNKRSSHSKNVSTSAKTNDKKTNFQKETKIKSTRNEKDNLSVPISRTKSSTADSIADFDDSEWTPPDSSYGAAFPVCGCVPKRVRQMIEMTLITAMVFFLIYLVVTTSMKIADAHRKTHGSTSNGNASDNYFSGDSYNRTGTSSSSSTNVVTDDDVYVETYNNNNDDRVGNVDDATAVDDTYNDDTNDDSNDDQYAGNDDAKTSNYRNYGNTNRYYNQNYNNYNQNNDDDSNERRSLLRSSEGKMINIRVMRQIKSMNDGIRRD